MVYKLIKIGDIMNNNPVFSNDITIVNEYDANGNLIATHDQQGAQIITSHDDGASFQTLINNTEHGVINTQEVLLANDVHFSPQIVNVTYEYNSMGQLIKVETQGSLTEISYQLVGQLGFFSSSENISPNANLNNTAQGSP